MGGLTTIAGQVPAIGAMPSGCRFAPRCPLRQPVCTQRDPVLTPLPGAPHHQVRCWLRAPPLEGAMKHPPALASPLGAGQSLGAALRD
jgi:hypothetical protein